MLHVINRIAEKRLQFGEHQFFDRLMSDASLQEVLPFAKHITFWVMTFQDILRINQLLAVTREVKRITHHHMAEDAGHQFWFLDDLHTIEASWPNVKWLFGSEHEQTRTSSFRLMSEVFRITKEHNRIVLLLVLEALGQEFFTRISDFLEKNGIFHSLRYFGRTHLTVEKQHEMFEIKMMEGIVSRAMSDNDREESIALVDRVCEEFDLIFNSIECTLTDTVRDDNSRLAMCLEKLEEACVEP